MSLEMARKVLLTRHRLWHLSKIFTGKTHSGTLLIRKIRLQVCTVEITLHIFVYINLQENHCMYLTCWRLARNLILIFCDFELE